MTLLELLVSAMLSLALSGVVLSLVAAGQKLGRVEPESLDQQQRARIALQVLGAELRDAGAGLDHGDLAGSLARFFPPIARSADGGITIWKTTNPDAQGTTAFAVAAGASMITLQDSPICPTGQAACGFNAGASAIAFTASGCRTTIRIAVVSGSTLELAAPLSACALDAGAAVAEADVRTYRVDAAARQLVRRNEATSSSAPFLDGVSSLAVAFFADPAGTVAIAGTSDAELMRVRRVVLTLRLTTSNPLLRVPDLDLAVDTVPRNLQG